MIPLWTYALLSDSVEGAALSAEVCELVLVVMYGVWLASILVRAVHTALHHPFVMVNGMITDTRVMSVEQVEHLRRHVSSHAKP